jgi:hypothetical protein
MLIEEFEANGKTLKIYVDDYPESPRSWDNLSRCIFTGGYQHLGDAHDVKFDGYYTDRFDFIEKGEQELRKQLKDVVICKPVHLYSHSGETISTELTYPYNCRWDSGTIGFVVVTKQDIRNNWGIKRVTQEYIDHAERILDGEIKTLDQFIRSEIYCFTVEDEQGDVIDSCGGFYGDDYKTNGMTDYIEDEELCRKLEEF